MCAGGRSMRPLSAKTWAPVAESVVLPPVTGGSAMPHNDNLLLASLSKSDIALLLPHLKLVQVEQHQILFEAGDKIITAHFPLTAIVSLVVFLSAASQWKLRWSDAMASYRRQLRSMENLR
jgi:hypothetical protein